MDYEYVDRMTEAEAKHELKKCIRLNGLAVEAFLRSESEVAAFKRGQAEFEQRKADFEAKTAALDKKAK